MTVNFIKQLRIWLQDANQLNGEMMDLSNIWSNFNKTHL